MPWYGTSGFIAILPISSGLRREDSFTLEVIGTGGKTQLQCIIVTGAKPRAGRGIWRLATQVAVDSVPTTFSAATTGSRLVVRNESRVGGIFTGGY
jgi:hypothetical protein